LGFYFQIARALMGKGGAWVSASVAHWLLAVGAAGGQAAGGQAAGGQAGGRASGRAGSQRHLSAPMFKSARPSASIGLAGINGGFMIYLDRI